MASSNLSDLREIGCKMTWPVHISPLSIANGTTIGLKSVTICPRPAHFSLRFLKSDRLLAIAEIEVCIFTDIGHAGQNISNRAPFRSLQNCSENLAVLRFRASSVRRGHLLQSQSHIFIDVTNYQIGRHISLLIAIIDSNLSKSQLQRNLISKS